MMEARCGTWLSVTGTTRSTIIPLIHSKQESMRPFKWWWCKVNVWTSWTFHMINSPTCLHLRTYCTPSLCPSSFTSGTASRTQLHLWATSQCYCRRTQRLETATKFWQMMWLRCTPRTQSPNAPSRIGTYWTLLLMKWPPFNLKNRKGLSNMPRIIPCIRCKLILECISTVMST